MLLLKCFGVRSSLSHRADFCVLKWGETYSRRAWKRTADFLLRTYTVPLNGRQRLAAVAAPVLLPRFSEFDEDPVWCHERLLLSDNGRMETSMLRQLDNGSVHGG